MDCEAQAPDRPAGCGADEDILPTLLRYRDRYRWSWNLSMRLINQYYGTNYTEKQLKALYKAQATKK